MGFDDKAISNFLGLVSKSTTNLSPAAVQRRQIATLKKTILVQADRIRELEQAILKHQRTFPDEPLDGELELWKLVGITELIPVSKD